MAKLTYIKLFVDYLDAIEPLGDAERGRLFTSLLEYARTGVAPQLNGNERFLFPMMRASLDRDMADMDDVSKARSEAGKKGAEAKSANASKSKQNQQMLANVSKSNKDKDKDKDKDKYVSPLPPCGGDTHPKRFTPPTVEEVKAYCQERQNGVDPQKFVDFYACKGWMVGKNPMKDWKAAVRTWEKDEHVAPSGKKTVVKPSGTLGDAELDAIRRALEG